MKALLFLLLVVLGNFCYGMSSRGRDFNLAQWQYVFSDAQRGYIGTYDGEKERRLEELSTVIDGLSSRKNYPGSIFLQAMTVARCGVLAESVRDRGFGLANALLQKKPLFELSAEDEEVLTEQLCFLQPYALLNMGVVVGAQARIFVTHLAERAKNCDFLAGEVMALRLNDGDSAKDRTTRYVARAVCLRALIMNPGCVDGERMRALVEQATQSCLAEVPLLGVPMGNLHKDGFELLRVLFARGEGFEVALQFVEVRLQGPSTGDRTHATLLEEMVKQRSALEDAGVRERVDAAAVQLIKNALRAERYDDKIADFFVQCLTHEGLGPCVETVVRDASISSSSRVARNAEMLMRRLPGFASDACSGSTESLGGAAEKVSSSSVSAAASASAGSGTGASTGDSGSAAAASGSAVGKVEVAEIREAGDDEVSSCGGASATTPVASVHTSSIPTHLPPKTSDTESAAGRGQRDSVPVQVVELLGKLSLPSRVPPRAPSRPAPPPVQLLSRAEVEKMGWELL